MNARQLLQFVARRLAYIRQLNLAIALICPILVIALALAIVRHGLLLPPFALSLLCLAVLIFIWFLEETKILRIETEQEDAARIIDGAVDGRERFLTLATVAKNVWSTRIVEEQSDTLTPKFSVRYHLPFRLASRAKLSLLLSPIFLALLIALLLLVPPRHSVLADRVRRESSERSEEIRTLARTPEVIPDSVRESLAILADTIEEKGIFDRETLTLVNDTIEQIKDFEQSEISSQDLASPPLKNTPPKPPESSVEEQPLQSEEQSAAQSAEQSSSAASAGKGQQGGKGQQAGGKGRSGESGGRADQTSEGAQGGSSSAADREAREGGSGNPDAGDEKRDVTGVGEGQGKGKSGEQKEQHGETQGGKDDSGAKEGEAKNDSAGQGAQDTGEAKKGGGKGESTAAEKKGEGSQGKQKGEEKSKGEVKDLDDVKDELNDLKEEIQREGSKPQAQQQEQTGEQRRSQQQEQQGGKEGTQGRGPNSGESSPGEQGKGEQPQQGDNASSAAPKPGERSGIQQTTENKGPVRDAQRDTTEKHAAQRPAPDESAPRFGPFDGGTEGDLLARTKERVTVNMPSEEKYTVGELGAQDPRRYKHQGDARAVTEIGEVEFRKPQPNVARSTQPIPVEYRDLIIR